MTRRPGSPAASTACSSPHASGLPPTGSPSRRWRRYQAYELGDWDAAVQLLEATLGTLRDEDRVHLEGYLYQFEILRGEPPAPRLEKLEAALANEQDVQTLAHLAGLRATIGLTTGDRREAEAALAWTEANLPWQAEPGRLQRRRPARGVGG